MSSTTAPRVVVITRRTEYDDLLARHGTRQQARFFLAGRGRDMATVERRHALQVDATAAVGRAIPVHWRRSRLDRDDLATFLFGPDDIVVAVGQDGLVANVAKYLAGQPVIGLNPDPQSYEGILVPHPPARAEELLEECVAGRVEFEERTMVEARLDDGQRLIALNELFVGHASHQSARYRIRWREVEEHQSSSGLLITTGTGATGWARSVARQYVAPPELPGATEASLAFFVREAFPSVATGTAVTAGRIGPGEQLHVISEMNAGGVIFGDGIEIDRLAFGWGQSVALRLAETRLRLVAG